MHHASSRMPGHALTATHEATPKPVAPFNTQGSICQHVTLDLEYALLTEALTYEGHATDSYG